MCIAHESLFVGFSREKQTNDESFCLLPTPADRRIHHSMKVKKNIFFNMPNGMQIFVHSFLMQTITTTKWKKKKEDPITFSDSLIARMSKYEETEIEEERNSSTRNGYH